MRRVSFTIANDWLRHPRLWRPVSWRTASGSDYIMFKAQVGNGHWTIRINDFPDEPFYTVLINGNEVMHFDDWPWLWRQPPFPEKVKPIEEPK